MRSPASLAAAVGMALLFARAGAQPFSEHLDGVNDAVKQRNWTAEDPGELRALAKCLKATGKPSRSFGRDLATAALLAKTLDSAFPEDSEFGPAIDDALAGFRSEIADVRDDLEEYAGILVEGDRRKDRALKTLDIVDGLLDEADLADSPADRAHLLGKATAKLDAGWRASLGLHGILAKMISVRVGALRLTASVGGEAPFRAYAGSAAFFPRDGALILAGHELSGPRGLVVGSPGISGPGSKTLTTYGGRAMAALGDTSTSPGIYTYESSPSYQGLLTVTTFDPERRLVEGTFYFEAFGTDAPAGDQTRSITSGTFRAGYILPHAVSGF